jgi:hypothetical protein
MDLVVRLQRAWCTFYRMSSWHPLTKLCKRKCLQMSMKMSNLGD